tara:strand:- start:2767 stop:5250 length:2484 start_codon:yes stop_codon:yes gene_type:complete
MKNIKLYCLVISLIICADFCFSQEVQSATLKYTPSENGYELNIPFKWKFINCYGEVHVTITKNSKNITSQTYIYNGKRYTQKELGSEAFIKPECGLTDIQADLYNDSFRLGEAKLDNVINWFGGCFGQTYYITKLVGVNDADYKEKLANLSLKNIRFLTVSSRDYKIEGKIKELEKSKSFNSKIKDADNAFSSSDYVKAKKLYEEALKIDYNSEHAKNRIKEINEKLKAEKEKLAVDKQLNEAKDLFDNGNYEAAKSAYEKALRMDANNSDAKNMLETINKELKKEKERKEKEQKEKEENTEVENLKRKEKESAVAAANNRKHSGTLWGKDYLSKGSQAGSSFQETNLIGLFKVDYDIWSLSGEPAHRFRFYWEWDNALYTGYPQYVSVLKDKVIHIADFKKYPDLLDRWNNIKPLYIELECDILYFKNGNEYIADKGTIIMIPEVIGKSGEIMEWSLPASPKWNELFTYTNGMNWSYFRNLGLRDEISEYADEFSTDIAWPKYAFEYSDDINFFKSHNYITSEWITIDDKEYENYSTSISIKKAIWPEEQMMALIEEFKVLEKRGAEEKMEAEDFWNTAENDKKSQSKDFWDTPDNIKTVEDVKKEKFISRNTLMVNDRTLTLSNHRMKYQMLKNPFQITSHKTNSTVEEGKIDFKGKLHPYLVKTGKVEISIKDEKFRTTTNSGEFNSNIILSEGWNDIQLKISNDGFGFKENVKLFYKKPPPLPCDELAKSGGTGQTINEHGLGTTSGVFYVKYDMFSAPDEIIVYAGPKERRSSSTILYSTYGKVSGSDRVKINFNNIDTGIVTVEINGSSGTSWNYTLECPE